MAELGTDTVSLYSFRVSLGLSLVRLDEFVLLFE